MQHRLKALIITSFMMGVGSGIIDPEIYPPDPDSPGYQAYMESCRQGGLRDMESQMRAQDMYYELHPEEL